MTSQKMMEMDRWIKLGAPYYLSVEVQRIDRFSIVKDKDFVSQRDVMYAYHKLIEVEA